jgi:hypothetical protein
MMTAASATSRPTTVNGLRLHYLDWGTATKPALIVIHGIARHAHTFDHIVPELARDYRVIAPDTSAFTRVFDALCAGTVTRPGVAKALIWSRITSRIWKPSFASSALRA